MERKMKSFAKYIIEGENTKVKQQEIEKAKLENVALQNALAGAIQQCDDFLKRLDDDISDEG